MKKIIFLSLIVFLSCETTSFNKEQWQRQYRERVRREKEDKRELLYELREEHKKESLIILKHKVTNNTIGTPEANLEFINISFKTIRAFEIEFRCYDDFKRPVKKYRYGSNKFIGIAQQENLAPGKELNCKWVLYGYDNTTNLKYMKIRKIVFEK